MKRLSVRLARKTIKTVLIIKDAVVAVRDPRGPSSRVARMRRTKDGVVETVSRPSSW